MWATKPRSGWARPTWPRRPSGARGPILRIDQQAGSTLGLSFSSMVPSNRANSPPTIPGWNTRLEADLINPVTSQRDESAPPTLAGHCASPPPPQAPSLPSPLMLEFSGSGARIGVTAGAGVGEATDAVWTGAGWACWVRTTMPRPAARGAATARESVADQEHRDPQPTCWISRQATSAHG
jgi:hypothetical protein